MTTAVEAPGVAPLNLSEAGSWLCSQDQTLRKLVGRIGAIGAWDDDDGHVRMSLVRDAVIGYDHYLNPVPLAPGPHLTTLERAVREVCLMSPAEVGRLRMLATLAPLRGIGDQAVRFCVADLETFNATEEGRWLIEDYLRCVRIGVLG